MGVCVFLLSAYAEWYGDDMMFKHFCRGEICDAREFKSPIDIIYSQANHYINANGRFVAHVLVQLFCGFLGPIAFGIFNAAMYIALTLLILSFIGSSIRNTKSLVSVIILTVICFSTKMMPSCQIGYIWSFVVALAFVKIFLTKREISPWWWIPLFIFAIIAGNFHEGVNFCIVGALFVWFIINLRRITTAQWIMLVGFGVGALLIVLSPASRGRVETAHTSFPLSIANLLRYGIGLYVLCAALILAYNKKMRLNGLVKNNYFFLSAVLFSLVLNLIITIGTSRQLYGMNLFCIIVALHILPKQTMSTLWIIITGFLAIWHLTVQIHDTCKMRMFTNSLSCQLATIDSHPRSMCWHSPFDSYTENNTFTKDGNLMKPQYDLSKRYPNVSITILPKYLQNLDTVSNDIGIILVDIGTYIVYSKKSYSDQNVSVNAFRSIGIPGTPITKPHSTARYSLNDTANIIYSYRDYNAMIVSQWDYNPIIRITDVKFVEL